MKRIATGSFVKLVGPHSVSSPEELFSFKSSSDIHSGYYRIVDWDCVYISNESNYEVVYDDYTDDNDCEPEECYVYLLSNGYYYHQYDIASHRLSIPSLTTRRRKIA